MNLEQLEELRRQALAHLNVVRRMLGLLRDDIRKANACDELVSMATLDLSDHLTMFEGAAVREYMRACQAVDDQRAKLAGFCGDPDAHDCGRVDCPTSDSYRSPKP